MPFLNHGGSHNNFLIGSLAHSVQITDLKWPSSQGYAVENCCEPLHGKVPLDRLNLSDKLIDTYEIRVHFFWPKSLHLIRRNAECAELHLKPTS